MSIDLVKVQSSATQATYGPTPAMWAGINLEAIRCDPTRGALWELNGRDLAFLTANAVAGPGYASTGVTQVGDSAAGGGVVVGVDTDNDAIVIKQPACPFYIARGRGKFAFEACVKFSTISNSINGAFIGLLEAVAPSATVPMPDDGTLSDNNMVGLWRLEGDGDKVDTTYTANGVTRVIVAADAATLVANTYIRLGMTFDGALLTFWSDGVKLAATKAIPAAAGTDFPNDVYMGGCIALKNASTSGTMGIMWARAVQEY